MEAAAARTANSLSEVSGLLDLQNIENNYWVSHRSTNYFHV